MKNQEPENADLPAIALATAEHPTLLRPSASEGKLSNAQRRMRTKIAEKMAQGYRKTYSFVFVLFAFFAVKQSEYFS